MFGRPRFAAASARAGVGASALLAAQLAEQGAVPQAMAPAEFRAVIEAAWRTPVPPGSVG